jgi:RNA polymerase sigma-70 factor (ECF subfamily)
MDERPDEALLQACRAGDQGALEALLTRHQSRIYRFAMRMCRDPEDASDVLQETLLAAARSLRDFRGGSSLSTWLYTIARSFCIKHRRRSKFAPAAEESLEGNDEARALSSPSPGPEERATGRELQRALEAAIARLEPESREVLLLRDGEGLTAPEVAAVVGASVDAVKSRLHRARAAVRAELAGVLGGAAPAPAGCPDVVALFSRHLEGDITQSVCAEMEHHVEACETCRARCDSLKQTLQLCSTSSAARVPGEVQQRVRRAIQEHLRVGA